MYTVLGKCSVLLLSTEVEIIAPVPFWDFKNDDNDDDNNNNNKQTYTQVL
jgi:hypothetical protein